MNSTDIEDNFAFNEHLSKLYTYRISRKEQIRAFESSVEEVGTPGRCGHVGRAVHVGGTEELRGRLAADGQVARSTRVDVWRTQVGVTAQAASDGLRRVTVQEPPGRHVDVGAQAADAQVARTLGSEHFFTKPSCQAEPREEDRRVYYILHFYILFGV